MDVVELDGVCVLFKVEIEIVRRRTSVIKTYRWNELPLGYYLRLLDNMFVHGLDMLHLPSERVEIGAISEGLVWCYFFIFETAAL